ncbi:MAG: hypothetical protein DWB43_00305 [Lautropia sp.]|nr:hypothetical protein [Lautropia sp.]RIK91161.1 MAG: hypothetical protein DCC70_01100 [Burkholderiales bacterium]
MPVRVARAAHPAHCARPRSPLGRSPWAGVRQLRPAVPGCPLARPGPARGRPAPRRGPARPGATAPRC